ncbi:MAG TPA: TonB-dependent receptor [Microvirga sp.]|jgi:vitamin B12 transporter|nr:TonB-dependent receptor [Microvirga sp.]
MNALSRRPWAVALSVVLLSPATAVAQTAPRADIVVTANRVAQPIQRAGSAISVITAEEIERSSARNVGDILQQVPGVNATQAGGPGQVETVRVRGGESRHTLVLVDGIRVNDPSSTGREFDFSTIVLADVERIEVLRGPQSALYGSDAMGGIINIITKRGRTGVRGSIQALYGSYNTKEVKGALSGGTDRVYYSLGFTGLDTDGFSAYGFRIPRIERLLPNLEADGATRVGFTGLVGFRLTDTTTLEAGGSVNHNRADYDAAFGAFPDTPSFARSRLNNDYARLLNEAFGGALRSTVTVFGNEIDRRFYDFTFRPTQGNYAQTNRGFEADRAGAEYQGDLRLGSFGLLTFGARYERETARGTTQAIQPIVGTLRRDFGAAQETRSAFALYQQTLGERFHISLGGRVDDIAGIDRFVTGRATAAYEIWETGTKLRGSVGTGGKAPSLFQLYSSFGTTTLASEGSFGVDAGIDQRFFDDAVRLSATVFRNRFENLIDFNAVAAQCGPGRPFGCYFNIAQAETQGLELEAEVLLNPLFRIRSAYTYLEARDLATGRDLARRPAHQGFVGVAVNATPAWTIEPRITYVGERFSSPNERDPLDAYARLDLLTDYKLSDTFALFARAENLTNTLYEETINSGSAGRSLYGGLRASW